MAMGLVRELNVKDFGAKGDNAANDTDAIQAAINAQKDADGGVVFLPRGVYRVTTLTLHNKTVIQGVGCILSSGGPGGTSAGTELVQIAGTADVVIKRAVTTQNLVGVELRDFAVNGVLNSSNVGGVQLDEALRCRCERVSVAFTNTFGFAIKNSSSARGAAFNVFDGCRTANLNSGAVGFLLDPGFAGGYVTATVIQNHTHETTNSTFVKTLWSSGQSATDGAIIGCFAEAGAALTMLDINGQVWKVIANRFETSTGAMTIALAGAGSGPAALFIANSFSAPGGIVWVDSGSPVSPTIDFRAGIGTQIEGYRHIAPNNTGTFTCKTTTGADGFQMSMTTADNATLFNPIANKGLQLTQAGASGVIQFFVGSTCEALVSASGLHLGASAADPFMTSGSGSPEGAVTAPVGSLYMRKDGSASSALYVKESGTGSTGWVAK